MLSGPNLSLPMAQAVQAMAGANSSGGPQLYEGLWTVPGVFWGLRDNRNSRDRQLISNPAGMKLLEAALSSIASNKR